MQVKKFEAPTIQEALDTIKRELGPEAIILQTRKYKKGFGLLAKSSVEVTAAVSERSIQKKDKVESKLPESKKKIFRELPAEKQANVVNKYMDQQLERAQVTQERVEMSQQSRKITATRYIDIPEDSTKRRTPYSEPVVRSPSLSPTVSNNPSPREKQMENQLATLTQAVQDLREAQENTRTHVSPVSPGSSGLWKGDSVALEEAFEQLVMSGVERRYALSLLKQTQFENDSIKWGDAQQALDELAEHMLGSLEVFSPLDLIQKQRRERRDVPQTLALVGPTGVGKTTTLAKIASEASMRRGMQVGFMNLDHYRVGAFDQLATYAKIFGVPFRSANTPDDVKAALHDFKHLDLILVDAPGYSQRDSDSLLQLQKTLDLIPDLKRYLVLAATTRETELYDSMNRFMVLKPQGLVVSKLDEAVIYGAIYNMAQKSKLPLAYFTTGQKVPDDIEEATRERVVALILDI